MKVDDIVRCTDASPWGTQGGTKDRSFIWGGDLLVTEIGRDQWLTVRSLASSIPGTFNPKDVELVDVNKSMTDQELADAYRKARQDCQSLYAELKRRGMSVSSSIPLKIWRTKTVEETF